jgi:uncharacterized protein (TIGR03435 family)
MRRASIVPASILFALATLSAQAPPSEPAVSDGRPIVFDVVSVKANASKTITMGGGFRGGPGRLDIINVSLRDILRSAYSTSLLPMTVEGPAALLDQHYDIRATAPGADLRFTRTLGPVNLALQRLLADRFRLTAHLDPRPVQGYALTLARADGHLGRDLRPSSFNCEALRAEGRVGSAPRDETGSSVCTLTGRDRTDEIRGHRLRTSSQTLAQFAETLQLTMLAPVADHTGLRGEYSIDVTYSSLPGRTATPPAPDSGAILAPDLDTALREQLGLKLERVSTTLDALVVDHVEPPTEN